MVEHKVDKISVDAEGSEEMTILISNMPPMKCRKQNLINSSDYFKALILNSGFKEGISGCVDFSLSE